MALETTAKPLKCIIEDRRSTKSLTGLGHVPVFLFALNNNYVMRQFGSRKACLIFLFSILMFFWQ